VLQVTLSEKTFVKGKKKVFAGVKPERKEGPKQTSGFIMKVFIDPFLC